MLRLLALVQHCGCWRWSNVAAVGAGPILRLYSGHATLAVSHVTIYPVRWGKGGEVVGPVTVQLWLELGHLNALQEFSIELVVLPCPGSGATITKCCLTRDTIDFSSAVL